MRIFFSPVTKVRIARERSSSEVTLELTTQLLSPRQQPSINSHFETINTDKRVEFDKGWSGTLEGYKEEMLQRHEKYHQSENTANLQKFGKNSD